MTVHFAAEQLISFAGIRSPRERGGPATLSPIGGIPAFAGMTSGGGDDEGGIVVAKNRLR